MTQVQKTQQHFSQSVQCRTGRGVLLNLTLSALTTLQTP